MSASSSHFGPHLQHTGTEPTKARSPYRLRLVLAIGGAILFAVAAAGAFLMSDPATGVRELGVVAALLAVLAIIDAVVVARRMHREGRPRHRG
ncbi:hypothetical protein CLV56_3272 [Mumia flava]|uniref:Uncharacterized protein n=1 Tax=Mumia flava TaxID=1348852 RepID=A0A0B2BN06_9ACTN|nr:DUF6343 family protein [Mumia flava]PJJ53777.1 hypothetical protein CLV56_3272 [Mumia flava]